MTMLPVMAAPAYVAPAATLRSAERATECRVGAVERSLFPDLRTNPVVLCPYDLENLYRRIGRLLDNRDGRSVDVHKILWTFGLPRPATAYDSDRIADYDVTVRGADGWTMRLTAKEARYPLDGKPAVFTRGVHPTRLVEIDTLDADYDITLRLPDRAMSSGHCLSIQDAADTLERAGWKDDTFLASASVTDGGATGARFDDPRRRCRVAQGMGLPLPDGPYDHPATARRRGSMIGEGGGA